MNVNEGVSDMARQRKASSLHQLTVREVYPSVETRDAALASGMSGGIVEGYTRLDALLAA